MKNITAIVVLLCATLMSYAQGNDEVYITFNDKSEVIGRIISSTKDNIVYVERHHHRDAKHYDTVSKSEVVSVVNKRTKESYYKGELGRKYTASQTHKLRKGAKAFVIAPDNGYTVHGRESLSYWGYWNIVDKREEADIVVDFKVRKTATGMGAECKGYVQVRDAKTDEVLLQTDTYDTSFKLGSYNGKITVCQGLVNRRLKPMIEGGNN